MAILPSDYIYIYSGASIMFQALTTLPLVVNTTDGTNLSKQTTFERKFLALDLTQGDHAYLNHLDKIGDIEPFVIAQDTVKSPAFPDLLFLNVNPDDGYSLYLATLSALEEKYKLKNGTRYKIYFKNMQLLSTTNLTWSELFLYRTAHPNMTRNLTFEQYKNVLGKLAQ